MQKPAMVYPENTNIPCAMGINQPGSESIYKTFLVNQLSTLGTLSVTENGGIVIPGGKIIETGAVDPEQNNRRPKKSDNHYLATGSIEYGFSNTIPIWLFGFLY